MTSCHLTLVAEIDDRLEDEDFDLIEENLGIQLQRVSALTPTTVRLKMTSCFSACSLVCLFVCIRRKSFFVFVWLVMMKKERR